MKLTGESAASTSRQAKLLGAGPASTPAWRSPYGADFDTLIRRGDEAQAAGKMRQAGTWYQRASRRAADAPRAQAEAVIRFARRWSDPGQVDREVIGMINAAQLALAGDSSRDATLLRLRLNAHLAKKLSFAVSQDTAPGSGPEHGVALARRTLREIPTDAPDEVRCEVLTECRWALFDYTPAAELLSISGRLYDASLRANSDQFHGEALTALAVDQLRTGQMPSALGTVDRHRTHAGHYPSAMRRWHQCIFDTLLDLWWGNFEACTEWIFGESQEIVAALEAETEIPADTLRQTRLGQAYWLLHERGQMENLFTLGSAGNVERYGYSPIWRAGLILAQCETDRWTDATDQLVAFAEATGGFRKLAPSGWAVPTLTLLAEACAALDLHGYGHDEVTGLAPLIDGQLAAHKAEMALAGWPTVLVGPVARARGLLALACGDDAGALESFRSAARLARTSRPYMARLRTDRARALLLRPARETGEEASMLLATSLAAAERLGMARLAADVRTLQAAHLIGRPP
jgi:hypothetical protein